MQQNRIRSVWPAIMVTLTAVLALVLGPASAHAAPRLPVTYNFLDGARAELAHPGGSLPGTNDFSCRPTPRHPRPVVLVHGSGGGQQTNWTTLAPVSVSYTHLTLPTIYSV